MDGGARLLVLAALALVSGGCAEERTPVEAAAVRDSAGIVLVENRLPLEELPTCGVDSTAEVRIGRQAGEEHDRLYRVFGAARLTDGRIAVVNQGSGEIRLYDAAGMFLAAAGRPGEGPGEFRNAFTVRVLPGDTIWVGDYRPWRFLVFSPRGEWVRTVTPEPRYVNPPRVTGVLDDGRMVLGSMEQVRGLPGFVPAYLHVALHDAGGALMDTLGVWSFGRWGQPEPDVSSTWTYPHFEPFPVLTAAGDRILVSSAEAPEVRVLDRDGVVRRIVRWNAGPRAVRPEDIEAERERSRRQYAELDPATRERLLAGLISPNRPAADRFPTLSNILAGRDGRLWVKTYSRPTDGQDETWLVFSPEGRLRCRWSAPAGLEEYEFGADYVLGKEQDELGVERVALYRLRMNIADRGNRGSAERIRPARGGGVEPAQKNLLAFGRLP